MAMRWISPIFEGNIYENAYGTKVKVTKVENARKVHFVCLDSFGYEGYCTAEHIRKGVFANPYDKTVCGIGFIGVGDYGTSANGVPTTAYLRWQSMLVRCYGSEVKTPYIGVTVAEDWQCYQNFAKWWEVNDPGESGWHLDKDILSIGNEGKLYSAETCAIIPKELNSRLVKFDSLSGAAGVRCYKGRFYARGDKTPLPTFTEAKLRYLNDKEIKLNEILDKYKELLDPRVSEAISRTFEEVRNSLNKVMRQN